MTGTTRRCTIRVAGHLDQHWSARLGDLAIVHDRDGTSTLDGPIADQAQLHGVLAGLRDIGAVLIDLHFEPDAGSVPASMAVGSASRFSPGADVVSETDVRTSPSSPNVVLIGLARQFRTA